MKKIILFVNSVSFNWAVAKQEDRDGQTEKT